MILDVEILKIEKAEINENVEFLGNYLIIRDPTFSSCFNASLNYPSNLEITNNKNFLELFASTWLIEETLQTNNSCPSSLNYKCSSNSTNDSALLESCSKIKEEYGNGEDPPWDSEDHASLRNLIEDYELIALTLEISSLVILCIFVVEIITSIICQGCREFIHEKTEVLKIDLITKIGSKLFCIFLLL